MKNNIYQSILKIRLNKAVFLSLLIVSILSYFLIKALGSFYEYKNVVNPKIELTLDRFHLYFKNELKKEYIKITAPIPLKDSDSPLKTFYITVKQEDLNTLNANLPESGKSHYIPAFLKVDDKAYEVDLRYRGDTHYHWMFRQKSLRVKMKNGNSYDMHSKFNLLNPVHLDMLMEQINYKLAKNEGVIAPEFYPVRVFINSEYFGVYDFLSQADESLLRKNKRMPGSIYSEAGANSDANNDKVHDLWWNSDLWEKKASRNRESRSNREDIDFLINAIQKDTNISFYQIFNSMFKKEAFYNFWSLDTLFGSYHHDFAHNHKIYFDPYKGQFEPIAWDQRRWSAKDFKITSNYPLVEKIRLNPVLEYEMDSNTYRLFNKYNQNYIDAIVDKYSLREYSDLESDKYRDTAKGGLNLSFLMSEYKEAIQGLKNTYSDRRKKLQKIFNDTSLELLVQEYDNYKSVTLYVGGNSPIKLTYVDYKILADKNLNGNPDEYPIIKDIIFFPGRKFEDGNEIKLPQYGYGKRHLINTKEKYTLFIREGGNFDIESLNFVNAITGHKVTPTYLDSHINVQNDSIHPWKLPINKSSLKTLQGVIEVKDTMVFNKYEKVVIEPGTTFVMSKNASIYFYGKVSALGTKKHPIRFIAKDSNQPWGIVAVQGKATSGSLFSYVEFENGSVDTRNLIHYTAPFNIHDSDKFEVNNCKIGRNFVGDDSMHVAYAKGVINGCEFYNARSDALDIDISDVEVKNNIFYKSGNDALDIMTTKLKSSNNIFIDTGDKGISVGEWSEAEIIDSLFFKNYIGLEIKDKSNVVANNLIFIDSKDKAINLYNKNKRYNQGGFLRADNLFFIGNNKVIKDKKSSFEISDKIEGKLPNVGRFNWYHNIKSTAYMGEIDGDINRYVK